MFEYTANSLNQYTRRTIPGQVDISGYAIPEAKVRIQKGTGKPTSPVRTNGYFFQQYSFDNSTAPVEETFKVYAVKNEQGRDLVSKQTLNVFIPKTPQALSYDADGNLLSDGRFQRTYNAENRVIRVEEAGKQRIDCTYSFDGNRTSVKIYSWDGSAWNLSSERKFVYDGNLLIAELDGSNNLLKSYIYGEDLSGSMQGAGGAGGLLAEKNASGVYFPAADGNGNVLAYVGTDEKIAAAYEYDAFGRIISKSGPMADAFAFRFSTQYYDKETASVHYKFRDYSPELKRFCTRDPINEAGGENLYAFVSNNTINSIDILGLQKVAQQEEQIVFSILMPEWDLTLPTVSNLKKELKKYINKKGDGKKCAELLFGGLNNQKEILDELNKSYHVFVIAHGFRVFPGSLFTNEYSDIGKGIRSLETFGSSQPRLYAEGDIDQFKNNLKANEREINRRIE